jgi:hypothetical protein
MNIIIKSFFFYVFGWFSFFSPLINKEYISNSIAKMEIAPEIQYLLAKIIDPTETPSSM